MWMHTLPLMSLTSSYPEALAGYQMGGGFGTLTTSLHDP